MDSRRDIWAGPHMGMYSRRLVITSGLGVALAGCMRQPIMESATASSDQAAIDLGALKPLDLSPSNLEKITVCLRPFRPAGPRLEAERVGPKILIHNYGHGGSGWSLAWGYAEEVRDLASTTRPREVSVVGAGAIGLTAAIALAETGAKVTIYAREMPQDAASSKATGVWSPSSRIGMEGAVDPGFSLYWQKLARRSHARHLQYVGRARSPVEYTPRFYIRTAEPEPPLAIAPVNADSFLHLGRTLHGLEPPWSQREGHPFPTDQGVRGGHVMTFNIAEYTRQLVEDFQALGGRIVQTQYTSQEELAELPGEVIVNCTGFGARDLVGDNTLTPVRGQIAWMAAQTDQLYGLYHRGVTVISRRDGLLIQETGGSDFYGLGEDDVRGNRGEFLAARAKVAPMLDWR